MTKFGAAENEMKRLMAKFAQGTPSEYSLFTKMKNPPKQDVFEGWTIKYQIGSDLRRVHSQIFRSLAPQI